MSALSNRVIALPQGRRLIVYSDLQLSPEMAHDSMAVASIVEQLNEIDEATVIIFAGSTFAFGPTSNSQRFVAACWQRFPDFHMALKRIASIEQSLVLLLP